MASWPLLVVALRDEIAKDYNIKFNEKQFRGLWLYRVKCMADQLNITLNTRNDNWYIIERSIRNKGAGSSIAPNISTDTKCDDVESLSDPNTSSGAQSVTTSASKLGYKLNPQEKQEVQKLYDSIHSCWQLSSGRYVEEVMKDFIVQLNYEQ